MHAEPTPARPRDHHDPERLALTRDAAARVAAVFHALTSRGAPRDLAQRFTLQCALALLAEGLDLLPRDGLRSTPPSRVSKRSDARGTRARSLQSKPPSTLARP